MSFRLCARTAAVKTSAEVLHHLQVDYSTGLDAPEVKRRRKLCGSNSFDHHTPESLLVKYLEQFKEPMILLLLFSAAVSFVMRQYDDTVSIAAAVCIVVTVAFIQNYRSEKALEALKRLMPPKCSCLRQGRLIQLLASDLVPGDVVYLSMGDRVPADLRLLDTVDLRIDESSLTGETEAVSKNSEVLCSTSANPSATENHIVSHYPYDKHGPVPRYPHYVQTIPLSDTTLEPSQAINLLRGCHDLTNIAFMGTLVCCGTARGVVIATGEHSEFGEVFKMMQSEEAPRTPLQKNMDRLGKHLSVISLCVIGLIVFAGLLQGRRFLELLNIGVSLAVAAIPEGLPIVVTVTLAIGQMRMAARNAIVRKLPAVETLGCVNVICADKTGTMTKNEMTVSQLVCSSLERFTITEQHRAPTVLNSSVHSAHQSLANMGPLVDAADQSLYPTAPMTPPPLLHHRYHSTNELSCMETQCPARFQRILEIGCVCNNAVLQDGKVHGQPTEGALLRLAFEMRMRDPRQLYHRLEEWSFSSDTKMMMVSCTRNGQPESASSIYFAKGAVDRILNQCISAHLPLPDASPMRQDEDFTHPPSCVPLSPEHRNAILQEAAQLGSLGLRVLAVAEGFDPNGLTFYGLIGLIDPPRPGVDVSVRTLLTSGVRVVMITGDSVETAKAIGSRLSLYRPGDFCLSGEEVDQLSVAALQTRVRNVTIFYRSGPRHKCKIVKALQQCGLIVAMTGDGVNDAVALKSADIGIAMGQSGTDVCCEASDIVLLDDNFATILSAMEEGKSIFHNIRNFVGFQLSTSIAALTLITLSTLLSLPTPLNAMQILYINILMDGPPAQSLGVEPPDDMVTKQPPRRAQDPILDRALITNVFIAAVTIVSGTFFVFWIELSSDHVVNARDTTMTFTCFVLFDMFNALSFRSQKKSIFSVGLTTNRMFLIAVSLSLFGQLLVIYFPPLQKIFQTEALSVTDLFLLLCISSSVFVISEIRKFARTARGGSGYTSWFGQQSSTHRYAKLDTNMV